MRPHLVILGAGASRAALPCGDVNGRQLPLMKDLVDVLRLAPAMKEHGVEWEGRDFETIYGEPALSGLRAQLEGVVESYFSALELPGSPTLYDLLLLSLRDKDVIATFNWDPFLIQAYRRNHEKVPSLPRILFLHGNVMAAYCPLDNVQGVRGARGSKCGLLFRPTRLLFPLSQKNYIDDPGIAAAWRDMRRIIKDALFVTVFGYGAPTSDQGAIELLSGAWRPSQQRFFEQFEVIDVRPEVELRIVWDRFIHTHHYDVVERYSESWLANHPRRSVEAFFNQYIEAKLIDNNPVPVTCGTLDELWSWFAELACTETIEAV